MTAGLLGFFLYSTAGRGPQNPADRLASGAGPARTIQQEALAARSQEARRALGEGTSRDAPLSEQHIQASLSALGDALAKAKAAVQGEAVGQFAVSDALQRIATSYGSSATPLMAGSELRAVRFDPPLPFDSGGGRQFLEQARGAVGLDSQESLVLLRGPSATKGLTGAFVFSRSFRAIPVLGNELTVMVGDGGIEAIAGAFSSIPKEFDTETSLDPAAAEALGRTFPELEGLSPDLASFEEVIAFIGDRPRHLFALQYVDGLGRRTRAFFDPNTRTLAQLEPLYYDVQRTTSGPDLFGEPYSFSVEEGSGGFVFEDRSVLPSSASGSWEASVALGTLCEGDGCFPFVSGPTQMASQLEGPWSPSGVSALRHLEETYRYFGDVHGLEGTGSPSRANRVFVEIPALDNAFYFSDTIAFGAGDQFFSDLAASKDVMAHELAHGVIEYGPGLRYQNQSGALNESYADVFGAMVDRDDWLVGEGIIQGGGFLRSLASPEAGGQPAHMRDFRNLPNNEEGDYGGVHINSGIPNRAFYLLAEGLSAEGLGDSVGKGVAEQIAYQTMVALGRESDFAAAAVQMLLTAQNLFGTESAEAQAVVEAWRGVGIELGEAEEAPEAPGEETGPTIPRTPEYELALGDDILIALYPRDGVIFDARQDVFDIFTVKACLSQECSGSIEQRVRETEAQLLLQNTVVGPINDVPAEIVSPSASTDIEGFTWIGYLGTDKKIRFGLNLNIEFEDIVFELGQDIQNFSVSRDFSRFAFVLEESATIFLYDFRTQALTPVQVEGRSYSTDGAGEDVRQVDSLSFSADGDKIAFDYKVCRPNDAQPEGCDFVWSIGTFDINLGFDYLFPGQPATVDVGFPKFSTVGGERIVFDYLDYEGAIFKDILGANLLFDYYTGELQVVNSLELEISASKNDFLTFGRPSFFPEDAAVLWSNLSETALNRLDSALGLQDDCTFGCEAFTNDQGLGFFQHILGSVHRAAYQSIFSEAVLSETGVQLGAVIRGAAKTAELSLGNAGNQDFEVSAAVTPSSLTTDLKNGRVLPGDLIDFSITLDTKDLPLGTYEGRLEIQSSADAGATAVVVSALVDRDSDGDGIPNSQDNDDDNDGAPDSRDAFPTDPSEQLDTDRDGIGNNADSDDDGDGLSDAEEIAAGLNPLAADSDGDSIPDGEELELGLDPLDGVCPSWYCTTSRSWLWHVAKLRSDRDGDGLSFERESALGTDPNRADSDGDGVADGEEVAKGYNPLRADSDQDGLSDGQEVSFGSNPLVADTDGDSVLDDEEFSLGLDPTVDDCPAWRCRGLPKWLLAVASQRSTEVSGAAAVGAALAGASVSATDANGQAIAVSATTATAAPTIFAWLFPGFVPSASFRALDAFGVSSSTNDGNMSCGGWSTVDSSQLGLVVNSTLGFGRRSCNQSLLVACCR